MLLNEVLEAQVQASGLQVGGRDARAALNSTISGDFVTFWIQPESELSVLLVHSGWRGTFKRIEKGSARHSFSPSLPKEGGGQQMETSA